MNDQDSASFVPILLYGYWVSESLEEASLGSSGFGKRTRAHDRPRTPVCHAEDNFASSFVGERDAVLDQFVKMETPPEAALNSTRALSGLSINARNSSEVVILAPPPLPAIPPNHNSHSSPQNPARVGTAAARSGRDVCHPDETRRWPK